MQAKREAVLAHGAGQAHRGYYITGNAIYGCYYISRDGCNIGSANNLAEAKATIDMLVDGSSPQAKQPQGGVYAFWNARPTISGSAQPGRVWVESINSAKGTAIVRYDAGEGIRSRSMCAAIADLDFDAVNGWRKLLSAS